MPLSDEHKKKISDAKTGVKRDQFSDEWLENLSKSKIGVNNNRYGIEVSDDTKSKISAAMKGRTVDPEVLARRTKGAVRSKINCPHCNRDIAVNGYARFHGDKCKSNPTKI